jgi:hypothetical protein
MHLSTRSVCKPQQKFSRGLHLLLAAAQHSSRGIAPPQTIQSEKFSFINTLPPSSHATKTRLAKALCLLVTFEQFVLTFGQAAELKSNSQ